MTTPDAPVTVELPTVCDGKEQYAFEEWAKGQRFDMTEHPLHYLFLNARTDAARDGWKAGLTYASRLAALASAPAGDGVEATVVTIAVKSDGSTSFHSSIPTGQSWQDTHSDMKIAMAEFQRQFDDSDRCPVKAAALARPRAAVGEREAIKLAIASGMGEYIMPGATYDRAVDAILALQSPPAKVEG